MECLQAQGLSAAASDIIVSSLRDSTISQYGCYIDQFCLYMAELGLLLKSVTETHLIEFLTQLFSSGLSYSTVNTARSAVSTFLCMCGFEQLGKQALVCRFMKGVFEIRPALKKSEETWNPEMVLTYLAKPNASIDFLSKKCVALLALSTSQRVSSIRSLTISDIEIADDRMTIQFSAVQKQTRPGFHQANIVVRKFTEEPLMCPVVCTRAYLEATAGHRHSDQLFLSYKAPFQAVSVDTLRRWLVSVLQDAGISQFSAHSYRSASTSALTRNRVPIGEVLRHAGWTQESTFRRYYDLPVMDRSMIANIIPNLR